ncbi:AAA family ATPase [Nonomuraea sp. FMUSA5-5]|uniref:AAA family ATPase n=1 Tax=Nonomuraea composti TaxID=2720023 RepID=A0ABX1BBH3_9ACTN|nr:LuxR family transcriptional regulator [Nonomuraea sp. FMUSA5-5]NJP95125.1 AAA family ATPase [Nonomuraea sp. FMUSA5-5]
MNEHTTAARPSLPRRETAQLTRLLEQARQGGGTALVVHGEAGLGKTVLLDDLMATVRGAQVLRASGAEFERDLAFTALHQLCAPLLPLIDRLPAPQRTTLRTAFDLEEGPAPDPLVIGLAVLGLLAEAATAGPVICVLDDAQWMDAGSAQALAFVARRIEAEPVTLLFAMREPDAVPALAVLPRLRLSALTGDEAAALLARLPHAPLEPEIRRRLIAEARGNPLALIELPYDLGPPGYPGQLALPVADLVEQTFQRRFRALPERTRRLLTLAAAEPRGDIRVLRHAAELDGLSLADAEPAETAGLLQLDAHVRFRHPLVRSAIYRLATDDERRHAHGALARAFDPARHPDRRIWHLAQAADEADEHLARELERLAGRARSRGGVAAAAAFLERATELTPDPAQRARRAVRAAQAKHEAGASEQAAALLAAADAGPLDDAWRARLLRLRGQIAFTSRRGDDAPMLLLEAAQQMAPLDPALARRTSLEALWAATGAERNGDAQGIRAVAAAILNGPAAPHAAEPPGGRGTADPHAAEPTGMRGTEPTDLLLEGLATLFTQGQRAAVPLLRAAVDAFDQVNDPRWLPVACRAAWDLWDEVALDRLATRCVELAREAGALTFLPLALNFQAVAATYAGRFTAASAMTEQAHALTEAIAGAFAPYAAIVLAAHQGDRGRAQDLFDQSVRAAAEGAGGFVTIVEYATAVLHNGLGDHEAALAPARQAAGRSRLFWSAAALPELVEAAARTGRADLAAPALAELAELTEAAGTEWGLGVLARSRALLSERPGELYEEAVARLSGTRVAVQLARTHLLHGEWLSRAGERAAARASLHEAHRMFDDMGAAAFAQRAARGLRELGDRPVSSAPSVLDALTSQEAHIARLVATGRTSREVAAELFLSPRTIDAHLHNIYRKLGIGSRRQLRELDLRG